MSDADLRLAHCRGLLVLSVPGSLAVTLHDGVLRYDPALPDRDRGLAVLRLLRELPAEKL